MMAMLGGCGDGYELPYYRIKESRDFRCWHFSDMPRQPDDVRSPGVKQTSRRKAATSVFDPTAAIANLMDTLRF